MENRCPGLDQQIASCRQLLEIFQSERREYLANGRPEMTRVLRVLRQKRQIVDTIVSCKDSLRAPEAQPAEANGEQRRDLVRELGALLEQLLVIDQENERVLRQLLEHDQPGAAARQEPARRRPTLAQRMPFAPSPPAGPEPAAAANRNTDKRLRRTYG